MLVKTAAENLSACLHAFVPTEPLYHRLSSIKVIQSLYKTPGLKIGRQSIQLTLLHRQMDGAATYLA